ncbi:MAG: class I SAM-dependent methyltransferase [Chloroflexota bacterium]|nr:class I SAM-dependent methyltransferase [Chloroflexota bacterium]
MVEEPGLEDQEDPHALTRETQRIWDLKADHWDQRMGEGNRFHRLLVGPAAERLLGVQQDELVLDVACGNGAFSRRLAALGARVVATDFSARFLELARARTAQHADRIEYRQVDATDEAQLLALGEQRFDAAVCNMALQDMVVVEPLFRALKRLLKPSGRFVFALPHPAFNYPGGTRFALEEEDRDGSNVETYYVKVSNYLDVPPVKGAGMAGEPAPHYYFHRTLSQLFGACFSAGFVLDGLEEPAFGLDEQGSRPLGWANFKAIPPVLAARLRPIRPTNRP